MMSENCPLDDYPHIRYGKHQLTSLGNLLGQRSVSRVLVVTDPGIVAAGIVERVAAVLRQQSIAYEIYDEVEPNPSLQTAEQIAQVYREEACQGMVAVGGGSPMDAAKGGGILLTNDGQLRDFADGGSIAQIANPLPLLVALPTTVGTGSEVTKFAALSDYDTHEKVLFTGDALIPSHVILDPELVTDLPAHLVASTGMDALTHGVEVMLSVMAAPDSDAVAEEAIGMIMANLQTAVQADPHSDEGKYARGQMLYASTIAGLGLNTAFAGLVHGMSHPLTSSVGIPHGLANAILLPVVMRFNAPACSAVLARVATAMGEGSEPEAAIRAMERLNETLSIPSSLRELGVTEALLPKLAQEAFESGNAQIINPRKPSLEQVTELYQQLL